MSEITVRIENEEEVVAALLAAGLSVQDILQEAVLAGAKVIEAAANGAAPGPHVISELEGKRKDSVTVAVGPDEEHWYYIFAETGAAAHEESPKKAKAMKIGEKFTMKVEHPGVKERPFLRPAVDENETGVEEATGAVIAGVLP